MNELAELRDGVIASMRGFVSRSLEPWIARIKALEDRPPLKGDKGDPGADGKSVDVATLSVQIIEAAAKAVEAIPKPKDGRDFDPELLEAAVKRHVEAQPKAINGKDGSALLAGDGPPMSAGKAGDVYLDAASGDLYRCV